MKVHNTLYLMTQGAYLTKDHQTFRVKLNGKVCLTVPRHHLDGVVCFGRVHVSPAVFETCGREGISLSFLSTYGRFLARVQHPAHGNVLLRREQYRRADKPQTCLQVARPIIAAKITNARHLLLRSARDAGDKAAQKRLHAATDQMAAIMSGLREVSSLDAARGIEGAVARVYFETLPATVRSEPDFFANLGRTRRPPRDATNALLSFTYALLRHDVASALETVGLDPAVGFLHADRPGRPSLALDLMEEFRPLVADRLVLTLINRRQVKPEGFEVDPAGGVRMDEATRRTLLSAYQQRKREEVRHPLLDQVVPVGLLPHLQARLLARTLRDEFPEYPALVLR